MLAALLAELQAPAAMVARAGEANTANEILGMATSAGLPLGDAVAARARGEALKLAGNVLEIEVIVFDRDGIPVGRAPFARSPA
jgi:cobalt-precorrin-5B (C1)-methyltransferase